MSSNPAAVIQNQLAIAKKAIMVARQERGSYSANDALLSLYTAVEELSKIVLEDKRPERTRPGVAID